MKARQVFSVTGIIVLVVAVTMLSNSYLAKSQGTASVAAAAAKEESVYDRVMKSGKIRCAYAEYQPFFHKDPNTGEFSGIAYEVTEKVGQSLGLKIEWTEEVAWGSIIEGLVSDRYDAFCSDLWSNPVRGKMIDFSIPISYSALNAYTRTDENRFASGVNSFNDPSVSIATMDGEMGDLVAKSQFPLAQRIAMAQGTDFSQIFLQVTSNKADIVFAEPSVELLFDKSNPGQLKNLTPDHPVRVLPNTLGFRRNQAEFKSMIDHALEEMINSGDVDRIVQKYQTAPGVFYPDAYPYRAEK